MLTYAYSDTKLLAKSVVSPITSVLSSTPKPGSKTAPLHATPQGRRSLIHLLTPRTRRHFTPAQIALMEETDAIRDQTSKKPAALREEEVRKAASPDLVSWIAEKGESVVKETGGCLVITEIMLYAEGGLLMPVVFRVLIVTCCFLRQGIRHERSTSPIVHSIPFFPAR